MKKIFMVIYAIKLENGGVTKVMLNRTHFFSKLNYESSIVTLDDGQDYERLEATLKDCSRLHKNSSIINFFDYYKNKNTITKNIKAPELEINEKGFSQQNKFFLTKRFIRYFDKDGSLIKTKYWREDGSLDFVEYYDENLNVKFIKIFKDDYLFKIVNYDAIGTITNERFFTPDEFCYFSRCHLGVNNKLHLFLFDREGVVLGFNSNRALHTHFIEELCEGRDRNDNIIICDGVGSSEKVINVNSDRARKILTVHTHHQVEKDGELISEIKKDHQTLFKNIDNIDHIVVLTEKQKKDLIKLYGNADKFVVIPNTIDTIDNFNKITDYEKVRKINIISRYVSMKNHEHVIHAVDKIIKNNSAKNIEVNFYGIGPNKPNLQKLVKNLSLQRYINIYDYVVDTNKVFREADLTVFTSTYEGFGLTLIESMLNKTPVISYDIDYGPSDIITDGVDGFLVKSKDVDALSGKILEVLYDYSYDRLKDISNKAYLKVIDKFSHSAASEKWDNLFNSYS